jgi:cytochrome P450
MISTVEETPMSRMQLTLDALVNDPLQNFARARAEGPIVDFEPGGVAVVRRDEVRALLADSRLRTNVAQFFSSVGVTGGPFYEWMAASPLNRDGADHQRWRAFMSRTFTPRNVEGLRPVLRSAAHGLIDAFAASGKCEFVADFADPYPSLGLCELIGVPAEDRDRFRGWANTIALGFSFLVAQHIEKVDAALVELLDYAGRLAAARRVEPRDDLVTRIALAAGEDGWSDSEVTGFIAGLTFAGHETTKNQLGAMVAVLTERADLWDAVATGSLAVSDVVEETLRYHAAPGDTTRSVAEPVEIAGCKLEAGTDVYLSIRSANHDEAAYAHADRLEPGQTTKAPHLAFGHGAHHCLGAALARAELQEALLALTSRIGCPTIGADVAWNTPLGIHGPLCLPLLFEARGME